MTYHQSPAGRHQRSAGGSGPNWLTGLLLGAMFGAYVLQRSGPGFTEAFIFSPALGETQTWRWLTAGFLHSPDTLMHLGVNAMALWSCGAALENVLGRWRLLTIFLVSVIGGHYAVTLLNDPGQLVLGASGGIFGLFGALLMTQLRTRTPVGAVAITIAANTALGFVIPGISWEAHLGGLFAGVLAASVLGLSRPRRLTDRRLAHPLNTAG